MALLLDLPPSVEDALAQEAAERGVTPEALAAVELERLFSPPPRAAREMTEEELLADPEQQRLQQALAQIIERAKALPALTPEQRQVQSELGDHPEVMEAILEKHRRQGFRTCFKTC